MNATDHLTQGFIETYPAEAAQALETMPLKDWIRALENIPRATLVLLLSTVGPDHAGSYLAALDLPRAVELLPALPETVAGRILRQVDVAASREWLQALPEETSSALQRHLRYPVGTLGAHMDTAAMTIPEDITLGEVLKRVGKTRDREHDYLYIVDRDHRLQGMLTLRELLAADPREQVGGVVKHQQVRLRASAPEEDVLACPHWDQFSEVPVVDREGRFQGIIRREIKEQLEHRAGRIARSDPLGVLLSLAELYYVGMASCIGAVHRGTREEPRGAVAGGGNS